MPFGTYSTFAGAGLLNTNYYRRTERYFYSAGQGLSIQAELPNYGYTSSNSGSEQNGLTVVAGLYSAGSTSSFDNSGQGATTFWTAGAFPTGSPAYSTQTESVTSSSSSGAFFTTAFIQNVGFEVRYDESTDSYYFADTDIHPFALNKQTTSTTDTNNYSIRSTTVTTLTLQTLETETTYTDLTETNSTAGRIATTTTETTTYGYGVGFDGGEIFCNSFAGVALIIQPEYGFEWTQDGNALQYLEIFTTTGTFGAFHASIIKDNNQSAQTFPAESNQLVASSGIPRPIGSYLTITIISESIQTITYDIISEGGGITLSFQSSYSFDGTNFKSDTDSPSSYSYNSMEAVSSTFTKIIASEVVVVISPSDSSGMSVGYFTTTKAIQASTTAQFFYVDQYLSYFSSFSYRSLVPTTAQSSYLLFEQGEFGSQVITYLTSSSTSNSGSDPIYTSQDSYGSLQSAITEIEINKIPKIYYKSFYSLPIAPLGSNYYTQISPAFRFVVGGTSDSIGGYKNSLSPESVFTKIYFTTYKFERDGAVTPPIIAIPIDFTSESESGTISLYTYQAVSIPSGFYFGSENASVYWTKLEFGSTTNTTQSFTIGYAGAGSELTMGYYGGRDESDGSWSPLGNTILHTRGLVNTISGASWSTDGYYYWSGSQRVTSSPVSSAINPIGNGTPITYIGSEWADGFAFPVVSILKTYINSYEY